MIESFDFKNDLKLIKKSIKIEQETFGTYVYALIISLDKKYNSDIQVPNTRGCSFDSEYYDTVSDSYFARGLDIFDLGFYPKNYFFRQGFKEISVLIPDEIIFNYIEKTNKDLFDKFVAWKEALSDGKPVEIKLIQATGVY